MFHEQSINSSKYKECMVAQTQNLQIMDKFWIVMPRKNDNPFNKDYINERATTLYSTKEEAEKKAESLAKQYVGISFWVFEVVSGFNAEIKKYS